VSLSSTLPFDENDLFIVFDIKAAMSFYYELSKLPLDEMTPESIEVKRVLATYTGVDAAIC